MFIEDWDSLLQIFFTMLIIYPVLILFLRISGKRTLAKWNAFDFVVTIAMGSILASVILLKDVKVLEGVFAFFLIILLQYTITWLSVRVDWVEDIVKATPTLLYFNNEFLLVDMKKKRVSMAEVLSAIRGAGVGDLEKVDAVVLETDGSFSVIKKSDDDASHSALGDVDGFKANKS